MLNANDLSANNVVLYVQACKEVARSLCKLIENGFSTIVLPSRGVYPIYKVADIFFEGKEFWGESIAHKWMILPFSYHPDQGPDSAVIRKHWVKVLAAESTGVSNPNWVFYQEKAVELLGGALETKPSKFGKFVMIDVAISGRAAVEMTNSLDEEGLDYHLLLLVTEGGNKLCGDYRRNLTNNSKVTMMTVGNIYSEDTGIAVAGITSVIFPGMTKGDKFMSIYLELQYKAPLITSVEEVNELQIKNTSDFYALIHAMHFFASKVEDGEKFSTDDAAVFEALRQKAATNVNLAHNSAIEKNIIPVKGKAKLSKSGLVTMSQ